MVQLWPDSAKLVSPRFSTGEKVGGPVKNMGGPIKLPYITMFKTVKNCKKLIFGPVKHEKFSLCLYDMSVLSNGVWPPPTIAWATIQVPCHVVKSVQLIWRPGTRDFIYRCLIFKWVAVTKLKDVVKFVKLIWNQAPVDEIYGCLIFKWVAVTKLIDKAPWLSP